MNVEIKLGDCLESLRAMPDQSVHCCVTSPPYFGLRDYGMDGQIGLEDTPQAFVARLVEVFREVRRVLRDDGTLWLNLGDSYGSAGGDIFTGFNARYDGTGLDGGKQAAIAENAKSAGSKTRETGLRPKNLLGIPWRVAFALQDDGWYLRQEIIWNKPNPMPESVRDRCTKAHEQIFLLSKSPRYYFDSEAIKEPSVYSGSQETQKKGSFKGKRSEQDASVIGQAFRAVTETRNRRSVWTVTTKPFKGAHFATFPPDLIEPCVLAGAPERCCQCCGAPRIPQWDRGVEAKHVDPSDLDRFGTGDAGVHRKVGGQYQKWLNENPKRLVGHKDSCDCEAGSVPGLVLDPFGGSGTTAGVALKNGRDAVICELNPEYAAMIPARIAQIAGKPQRSPMRELLESIL